MGRSPVSRLPGSGGRRAAVQARPSADPGLGAVLAHLGSPASWRLVPGRVGGDATGGSSVVYTTDHSCRIPNPSPVAPTDRAPGRLGSLYAVAPVARAGCGPPSTTRRWPCWPSSPCWPPSPGVVTDDTKTYLYLDPGRYVRQAVVAVGPGRGPGHGHPPEHRLPAAHGPLLLGPGRAPRAAVDRPAPVDGLPAVRRRGRRPLPVPGHRAHRARAATWPPSAFMFTPYVLQYSGRISVILLPWSGLPWMVAFVILALRRGGWRYPALFALVVALVSGINASSILFVGIAPALWLPYAVVVAREATWRTGLGGGLEGRAAQRAGLAVVGGRPPGGGGLRGQRPQVHRDGAGHQRGLAGLGDHPGPRATGTSTGRTGWGPGPRRRWPTPRTSGSSGPASPSRRSASWPPSSPAGGTAPTSCCITVVGMVLAVGPNPYADPSGVGSVIKTFLVDTTAGLALRSTDRASPLVILGLAMFLGAGVSAVAARVRRTGLVIGALRRGRRRRGHRAPVDRGHHRRRLHPAGRAPRLRPPGGGRPRTPPTRAPGSTPCPATTSPPTGGATPSTPSTPA